MLRSSVIAIFAEHSTRPEAHTIILRVDSRLFGGILQEIFQ
jgi:hypothetical protein